MAKNENKKKDRRDFIIVSTYAMGAVGAGSFVWPLMTK